MVIGSGDILYVVKIVRRQNNMCIQTLRNIEANEGLCINGQQKKGKSE